MALTQRPEFGVILRQPEPPFVFDPVALNDMAAQDGEGSQNARISFERL